MKPTSRSNRSSSNGHRWSSSLQQQRTRGELLQQQLADVEFQIIETEELQRLQQQQQRRRELFQQNRGQLRIVPTPHEESHSAAVGPSTSRVPGADPSTSGAPGQVPSPSWAPSWAVENERLVGEFGMLGLTQEEATARGRWACPGPGTGHDDRSPERTANGGDPDPVQKVKEETNRILAELRQFESVGYVHRCRRRRHHLQRSRPRLMNRA